MPQSTKKKQRLDKWRMASILLLTAAAIGAFYLAALPQDPDARRKRDDLPGVATVPTLPQVPFMVLVARREEKGTYKDVTPHRNSLMALYKNNGSEWEKIEGELSCRSESTQDKSPTLGDFNQMLVQDEVAYGYQSVPVGVYTLVTKPWRTGDEALLLSDWGRFDGKITMEQPQVIRTAAVDTYSRKISEMEGTQVLSYKQGAYFHPSSTSEWSFMDSRGCINIYKAKEPEDDKVYPWDEFANWFDKHRINTRERSFDVMAVVAPFSSIPGATSDALPLRLPISFAEKFQP